LQSGPIFDDVFRRLVDSIPASMLIRYVSRSARPAPTW
jgi:hypothetical protein